MRTETKCLHSGYHPANGDPLAMPIYQSTTYKYDSTEAIGQLFDLAVDGHMYSRISNPTVAMVEEKLADLEGGVGALCTTSGQMATLIAVMNIASQGDEIICAATVYGGTLNLLGVTLERYGIHTVFADLSEPDDQLQKYFNEKTKAVLGETLANPALDVLDIERIANLDHRNGVPLIVDNTFATPVLCRPFEFGADIVTHSTTKYLDGHAIQVGGAIIDSGRFDWTNGKFPGLVEPDASYHGVAYVRDFGEKAYITKARVQLMRDLGGYPPALSAFLLNIGIETLHVRMERHCRNAERVAQYLASNDRIESVNYPGLEDNRFHELAQKYLPNGCSGVISFCIKGGKENAAKFMNHLKLAVNAVHVAASRTLVLHPASATHRQLTDEQLVAAGISPGMIRFSVGIEDIDDIIEDIEQALAAID